MKALEIAIANTTIPIKKVEPRQPVKPKIPPSVMNKAIKGINKKVSASPRPPPGPEYISMAKPRSLTENHFDKTAVIGT